MGTWGAPNKLGAAVTTRNSFNTSGRKRNVVHASFGLKSAVWFVNIWGLLIVYRRGCDVHRRSVGKVWSSGLPRRRTEAVLVASRDGVSRRSWSYWILLV